MKYYKEIKETNHGCAGTLIIFPENKKEEKKLKNAKPLNEQYIDELKKHQKYEEEFLKIKGTKQV